MIPTSIIIFIVLVFKRETERQGERERERMLYNIWHGFSVRSWWPRVLWQAVTLWLVNWGMVMRRSRPVEQVCNRKESWESGVEPGIGCRSEVSRTSLTIRLARRCKRWHPMDPGRRYGTRRSPLSEYMSVHLSLKITKNCVPLSRTKWEIYFFIYVFLVVHRHSWVYNKNKIQYIHVAILFTNPSARAGYDTRSFFKRSLTGLNSEFSFS